MTSSSIGGAKATTATTMGKTKALNQEVDQVMHRIEQKFAMMHADDVKKFLILTFR